MREPARRAGGEPASLHDVGVVAIGRNEGERLQRCLDALPRDVRATVYVDSGSTDDSVDQSRRRGVDVVQLDMSVPFTAARARNAGLRRLLEQHPDLRYVQLVDGDCAIVPGWLEAAVSELEADPRIAMVCGRRREVSPEASVFNWLCDVEWIAPVGDVASCGGDALARVEAVREVGGFDEHVMAGEEPELCARLRARGWRIRRVAQEMTLHDAAMSRFGQWWRRAVRSGHGFAEVSARSPDVFRRELRSSLGWGLLLPAAALLVAIPTGGLSLGLLLAYPALWGRIALRRRARGDSVRRAAQYATFCIVGKPAEATGVVRCWWARRRGRRSKLIEYK